MSVQKNFGGSAGSKVVGCSILGFGEPCHSKDVSLSRVSHPEAAVVRTGAQQDTACETLQLVKMPDLAFEGFFEPCLQELRT